MLSRLARAPDGKRLALGSRDHGTVQIVDVKGGNVVFTSSEPSSVNTVAWSPDGKWIASGNYDKIVRVWSPTGTGRTLVYKQHPFSLDALAWSPDSTCIVSSSSLGQSISGISVQVWEVASLRQLYEYSTRVGVNATDVAWSPDGKRSAVATDSNFAMVWDANSDQHIFVYHGNASNVALSALAWSPDSRNIVTATTDMQELQVWQPGSAFLGEAPIVDLINVFLIAVVAVALLLIVSSGSTTPLRGKSSRLRVPAFLLVCFGIAAIVMIIMGVSGWNPYIGGSIVSY